MLLYSLAPWESYEPSYSSGYRLNSTTSVCSTRMALALIERWYAIKNKETITKKQEFFSTPSAMGSNSVTVLLSLPNTGWFHFQSADCIYLSMTQLICYLPILCLLDPDNRSITNWSWQSGSKQMRPHN